ncbi:hypothetical protein CSV61_12205 [Sporosarcina sp. P3]|uniref:glutamine amidotransferase-related protein n=1 Tax=Sporosarcina sp. P3 TaxID=2048245 RepID=UPI000C16FC13|nr:gamma-glutamyl-gamma-aminobutyrate hydrolase family protein [Sporosarcina sp. P3]PID20981.1 hypothetical protein CSV61_12205 [Sporosarcina sp. P3]
MEKHVLIINNEKYENELGWSDKVVEALNNIEEVTCTVSHYSKIDSNYIKDLQPQYIIMTGRIGQHWEENEISDRYIPKLNIIKDLPVPVLGICAGLQLTAIMYGGKIGKMVESSDDILEEGYIKHFIKKDHQLLEGVNTSFYCRQLHRDEVKTLPEEFDLLASSEMCAVQMIAHKERPLFGVQFHPEWYNSDYPAGKMILKNFLNIKF